MESPTSDETPQQERGLAAAITRGLMALSSLLMFAMTAITFADVIGRYFLNRPIAGAAEIISLALGLTVFTALPMVTHNESHITIDLFESAFKGRVRKIRRLFVLVGSTAMLGLLTSLILGQAIDAYENSDVTYMLGLPKAPMIFMAAALAGLAALLLLPAIWRWLIGADQGRG